MVLKVVGGLGRLDACDGHGAGEQGHIWHDYSWAAWWRHGEGGRRRRWWATRWWGGSMEAWRGGRRWGWYGVMVEAWRGIEEEEEEVVEAWRGGQRRRGDG